MKVKVYKLRDGMGIIKKALYGKAGRDDVFIYDDGRIEVKPYVVPKDDIVRLYRQGRSGYHIAKVLNCPVGQVYKVIKETGVKRWG